MSVTVQAQAIACAVVLFAAGAAAAEAIGAGQLSVEKLFAAVNGAIIVAIMGITTVLRYVGGPSASRWTPLAPMLLGLFAGWLVADDAMNIRQIITLALLYSGAASIGYLFIWKTVMKKGLEIDDHDRQEP